MNEKIIQIAKDALVKDGKLGTDEFNEVVKILNNAVHREPAKLWVIIEETDDYILCHGVYKDSFTALGHLIALSSNSNDEWIENDYKLAKKDEFYYLECDGWGWHYEFIDEEYKREIKETWYLLDANQTDSDLFPRKEESK